jgi:hypothetical protein
VLDALYPIRVDHVTAAVVVVWSENFRFGFRQEFTMAKPSGWQVKGSLPLLNPILLVPGSGVTCTS